MLNDKIDQNTNVAKFPSAECLCLYKFTSYIQLLSFDSCYFCVSFSHESKSEKIERILKHKIRAQAPSQDKNPDWTLRRPVASAAFDVLFSLMIPEPERFKPQWNIEGTVYILGQ